MGKTRLLAETGAGQNGWAPPPAAALLGLSATVLQWATATSSARSSTSSDEAAWAAEVVRCRRAAVPSGTPERRHCASGCPMWMTHTTASARVMGPHPYPWMVREVPAGRLARRPRTVRGAAAPGGPDRVWRVSVAAPTRRYLRRLRRHTARLVGVEPAAARRSPRARRGLHGFQSYVLQDEAGQIVRAHSISARLDYPGSGRNTRPTWPTPAGRRMSRHRRRGHRGGGTPRAGRGAILCVPASAQRAGVVLSRGGTEELPAGRRCWLTLSGRGDRSRAVVGLL